MYQVIEDVNKLYQKDFDKENQYCSSELGKLCKQTFPGITRTRTTVLRDGKKKREWVYQGLVLRDSASNCDVPAPTEKVTATYERIPNPSEFWNKLPVSCKNLYGWQYVQRPSENRLAESGLSQTISHGSGHEWIFVGDNSKCNNNRVLRELIIHEDLDFSFTVMGKTVSKSAIPATLYFSDSLNTMEKLVKNLFYQCASLRLCTGFEVAKQNNTYNSKGIVVGVCEEWFTRHSDGTFRTHLRHRASDCDSVLTTNSKHQVMCQKCSTIKHNSYYKTLNPKLNTITSPTNKKFKRESWMQTEEKMEKLREEKERRKKAERREEYLRAKIARGMHEFDDEDNNDFAKMFNMLDEDKLPEDMKMFYKVQLENLGKKSSKGYRWHPK